MPTVFASVSITLILFYLVTLFMAYRHLLPVGLHMLWGFFMAILIILLQCLIFGFFIGSGKSIKRVVKESGLSGEWIEKTKEYKNRSYPMLMLAILISVAAAVVGGGVATGSVPSWIHQVLVWAALGVNAYSLRVSYKVVVENVEAIHRINAEVRRGGGTGTFPEPGKKEPPAHPEPSSTVPVKRSSPFYFFAVAVWVPYLYVKFSLGSRTFPYWPFLVLSALCLVAGWWKSKSRPEAQVK